MSGNFFRKVSMERLTANKFIHFIIHIVDPVYCILLYYKLLHIWALIQKYWQNKYDATLLKNYKKLIIMTLQTE